MEIRKGDSMNQRVLVTAGASGIGREIFNFLSLAQNVILPFWILMIRRCAMGGRLAYRLAYRRKCSVELKDWIVTLHQRSCSKSMAASSSDVMFVLSTPTQWAVLTKSNTALRHSFIKKSLS
jgi:hypothetical protein